MYLRVYICFILLWFADNQMYDTLVVSDIEWILSAYTGAKMRKPPGESSIFSVPENGKVHSYFFMYKKVRVHKQVLYIKNDV